MPSPYRTLDDAALEEVVAHELFAWGASGGEGYALGLEALPVVWPARDPARRTLVRISEPTPGVPTSAALLERLSAAAAALGATLVPGGRWGGTPAEGPWIELGPAGQVVVQSGWAGSPARAEAIATGLQDALRGALEQQGLGLVCIGHDPWHPLEARASIDATPWGQCEERVLGAPGSLGAAALRLSAATQVRIAFGGPVKGPRRWRAAWLAAPYLTAALAHAPLEQGASARVKSARARAWRHADPTRCGFPRDVLETPSMVAAEQYLHFALGARVLWILRDGQAFALPRAVSFEHWMSAGIDGLYPELDDWRAHLATLRPLVRPEGALALAGFDVQARAFAGVPLALAAALLVDDAALEAVLERFAGTQAKGAELHEAGLRDGLLDERLAEGAQALFAIAADSLLRAPRGWISNGMLAAFVAFQQLFPRHARTPADELLEAFLERGALDRRDLEELEDRWCAASGTSAVWRSDARPA